MASNTEKRRKVPWHVAIPSEVIAEYAEVKLGAYYNDPETMLKTQLKAKEIFRELYGISSSVGGIDMSAYFNASIWGLEVVFPENEVPMPKGPVINNIRQVDNLRPPDDLMNSGLMPKYIKFREYMKRELKWEEKPRAGGSGTQGPFTTAVLLRGGDLFADLYEHPDKVHRLLELITENSINLMQTFARMSNITSIESVGMTDDFSGLLTPAQYREFVLPYNRIIYEKFGKKGRSMHSELLRRDHLKFLSELGITSFDPGNDQYLTIEDIKSEISIPFTWNIKPFAYLLLGTPKSIRKVYKEDIDKGAPIIMTELCRGIPRENVAAFIAVAREYE